MKLNQQKIIIKRLRGLIPESNCKKGCIDCCGPVPWVFWEKKQIQSLVDISQLNQQKTVISKEGISCPYCDVKKGCIVYEERPILCRIFGISEDERIKCPKGLSMPVLLSFKQTEMIMTEYLKLKPSLILGKALEQITGKKYLSYINKYYGSKQIETCRENQC